MLADLRLATAATLRAGAAVLRHFGTDMHVEHKTPTQPLTAADLEADAMLREELTGARPDYGWLSEETRDSADRLQRSRVWIVDPIDGTRSFIAGLPEFTLSVGLVADGAVVLGLVYNPVTGELFQAVRGDGASLIRDGVPPERLAVAAPSLSAAPTMLASRSEIRAGHFAPLTGYRIEPVGSTAYKLALVAAGRGDVFLSRGPKSEWDICAGALLVSEAGGLMTDIHGAAPAFNRRVPTMSGVLAAGRALHGAVLNVLETLPAREEV